MTQQRPKVVIVGAGGMIGRPLMQSLAGKYDVTRFKRSGSIAGTGAREVVWDPSRPEDWRGELEGVYAVINLSGESIAAKRWTAQQKKELIRSRLMTTQALVDAMSRLSARPKVFLSASAVGFYGPRGAEPLDETSPPGKGFLSDLCREWERQAFKAQTLGIRTACFRTGVVLHPSGGALAKMLPPFRFGLGGPLGSGHQYLSWIHLSDEVGAIEELLHGASYEGPVNLTAPHPVDMREFSRELGAALRRPALFPVPGPLLKLMLGEMAEELLLSGQNVRPSALIRGGFTFRYPQLRDSLIDLLSR